MKRFVKYYFIIIILIFLNSCINKDLKSFSSYEDFNGQGMVPYREYMFFPFKEMEKYKDTENFSISIEVRYSDKCNIRYLPLKVEYSSLERDTIDTSLINIPLFDANGQNTGKGNYGIFDYRVNVLPHQKPEEGFFMALSTEERNTNGILALGVICQQE